MKFCAFLVFGLAMVGIASSNEELDLESTENRDDVPVVKRSSAQFYYLIRKYTGRDPKDYIGYGCWCGYGGKGKPLDGVDRCCQIHDKCYNRLYQGRRTACSSRYQLYYKTYYHWGLRCHTGWGSSRCGRGLCYCDVAAVKCFKRNHFNNRHKNWNKNSCP